MSDPKTNHKTDPQMSTQKSTQMNAQTSAQTNPSTSSSGDSSTSCSNTGSNAEFDDTYCHSCHTLLNPHHFIRGIAECPDLSCLDPTCRKCKQMSHAFECGQAAEEGWTKCPSCPNEVKVYTRENHAFCECKAEFCYLCGAEWKTCDCEFVDEDRILETGQLFIPGKMLDMYRARADGDRQITRCRAESLEWLRTDMV